MILPEDLNLCPLPCSRLDEKQTLQKNGGEEKAKLDKKMLHSLRKF